MTIFHGASHMAISGGNFIATGPGSLVAINQGSQPEVSNAFKDLSAAAAHTAFHDSAARFNAPRCHRNTRTKYRDQLGLWMVGKGVNFEGKQLIWLNGGAGAGKSAIMQSVVEQCAQHGSVLGSFFFSRADPSRNTAEALIPTLAYQVAHAFPEAMAVLDPFIQRNPLIFKASLQTQTLELLIRPLLHLFRHEIIDHTGPLRRVFAIDGLDECDDPQKQALIIHIIASMLSDHHLPICFLIASRLEIAISSAFERENKLRGRLATLSLGNDADAESDIRQFIEDSFRDILDSHPWRMNIKSPWPSRRSVNSLVAKSSGHFIYAATAMRYIASFDEHPERALNVVDCLEPSRRGSPFAELDALYMHILTSAKYSKQVLEILRHHYLSRFYSHSVASVCYVHNIAPHDVLLFLSDIQSLVALVPRQTGQLCIAPKHASLGDFIKDEARAQELYIAEEDYHGSLLARYFQLLDAGPDKLKSSFDSIDRSEYQSDMMSRDASGLLYSAIYALSCSKDTDTLRFLTASHSPVNIWNFCIRSLAPGASFSESVTDLTNCYICVIRDLVALHDNTQYIHQLKMYIELVLDHINDLAHKKPLYRIIPALMFSSDRYGLSLAHKLMYWDSRFQIEDRWPNYIFEPLQSDKWPEKIDPRACEAIRQMPQSQLSWSADLAVAMSLFMQRLVHLSGHTPSILHSSPHIRWLQRHKGLKHTALGSPRMSSALSHHIYHDYPLPYGRQKSISFLYSCWRRLQLDPWEKVCGKRRECRALLKAVILYLHKADLTNEVAVLARRSLPIVALWFPKLMKRARAEMDAYVQRWEDSPEGLLEMSKSLRIDDMD